MSVDDANSATSSASLTTGWRAFFTHASPTTLLFACAALYSLVALAWSVAGRDDLDNARAAAFAASVALAIALVTVISNIPGRSLRRGFVEWVALATGIGLFLAVEIARLTVILGDSNATWNASKLLWLQSASVLIASVAIVSLLTGKLGGTIDLAAASALLLIALALALPFTAGLHLALAEDASAWQTIAPLLAVATGGASCYVALKNWIASNDESDVRTAGLAVASLFLTISLSLHAIGVWDDAPGLLALAQWVLPVVALGVVAAAIGVRGAASPGTPAFEWRALPVLIGRWPAIAGAVLIAAAVATVAIDTEIEPDLIAAGVLGALLLFTREALTLRAERGRAEDLRRSTEEYRRLANIDLLTTLPNRAALTNRLAEEFERAFRYKQPMSVLFIDIDYFKRVNDTLGHAAGDQLLRQVADALRATARSIDFVGRYGGEEFLVIAPGTWTADALILAERLRNQVRRITVPTADGASRRISISVGVAGYPEHAESVELVLERADQALYAAKSAGRDRAVLFSSGEDD